jgi:hypothetical protein
MTTSYLLKIYHLQLILLWGVARFGVGQREWGLGQGGRCLFGAGATGFKSHHSLQLLSALVLGCDWIKGNCNQGFGGVARCLFWRGATGFKLRISLQLLSSLALGGDWIKGNCNRGFGGVGRCLFWRGATGFRLGVGLQLLSSLVLVCFGW